MKVLYDINVLGVGYYHPRARTGVFRVVENIAYGLKESQECDLSFCSNSNFENAIHNSLDYLDDNPELTTVNFPLQNAKIRCDLKKIEKELTNRIDRSTFPQYVPLKIARRLATSIAKKIESRYDPLEPRSLAAANIYHSPFHPIPDLVKESKNISEFLSVYDLIPILYPEFFKFYENTPVKRAIDGLSPASWALCISQCTKDDLCNYSKSIDPARVFVTHLAASDLFYECIDLQKMEITRKKYQIPNVPYILSLSTLEPRKNIEHTIQCFSALVQQENIEDLHLVLVGAKGWNYDAIFSEIANNPALESRIIVTGYVADEDLAALYSGAMAFVYPSFYEGFGLPPLEAMQCGVPVITSNTSSLPEVVGDAGIMLDPTDKDGLCQNLLKLYGDSALRKSMSEKSITQAQKFSWERCTQETIAAYKIAVG
jgi:glycosyltransferase involved in cell wall biosynthesis